MTWNDFVSLAGGQATWTLVGPLYAKSAHRRTHPTIYVDGGVNFYEDSAPNPWPFYSLGDGDSRQGTRELTEILPRAKDFSDLSFALSKLPTSVEELELLGFLGGRRDHEYIGLGEVYRWLSIGSRKATFDEGDVLGHSAGAFQLTLQGLFSVILFEDASLSITGQCQYPLSPATPLRALTSRLLSNEGAGRVDFACTKPCFIFNN